MLLSLGIVLLLQNQVPGMMNQTYVTDYLDDTG
jgi:hypothetical protein